MVNTPDFNGWSFSPGVQTSSVTTTTDDNYIAYLSYTDANIPVGSTVTFFYYMTNSESVVYQGYYLGNGVEYPIVSDAGYTYILGQNSGTYAITADTYMPCFLAGTCIDGEFAAVPVESLRIGDSVRTGSGALRPVKWIGHRDVSCRRHPAPESVWPVRIAAGAFGMGQPRRDLYLSPDHAVFVQGVLIPIKHLINNATIQQVPRKRVSYYHVELDSHDVLRAEGLPCESYLDNGRRSSFANGGAVVALHPEFSAAEWCEATGEAAACAPLRIEGEVFTRVDAELRRRAADMGYQVAEPVARPTVPDAISTDLDHLLQPDWYLAHNPDVAAAGVDALAHYIGAGRREGRLPCPEADLVSGLGLIEPATVVRTMPDVVAAGAGLAAHFCSHGWREHRRPNPYFDPAWYIATHSVPDGMNPLVHYVLFGEGRGLAPSPHFAPAWYRQRYAVPGSACALAHYLQHRRTQRVSPLPTFDVAHYARDAAALLPHRDPYAHFLAHGFPGEGSRQAAA